MIHQLIFAGPKPGMSVDAFQRYWLDVHAVQYASKIPQIRKYLVDTVVPGRPVVGQTPWSGVAEIWLADEHDQVASLQTPEFLQARLDEPRWAAFWRTVVLDTDAHDVMPGGGTGVKLILLAKRAEGIGLAEFRQRSLSKHADLVLEVPGLRGYLQGHTRDGAYGVGEAVLDAAYQLWFDDVDALERAVRSPQFARAEEDLLSFVVPRYLHRLAVAEHWIIGPQER
jgi:uncharacterized protein (TIGR02118 family)